MIQVAKNITLYWKCQILGWLIFMIVAYSFNGVIYGDYLEFIPFAISIFLFGFIFSHLLKTIIKKLGLLKKSFSVQVFYLALLTLLFAFGGTYIWMKLMIKAGIWVIETNGNGRYANFRREYFFNLFPILSTLSGWVLIYFLFHYVKGVRREEQLKIQYKVQMIELEAKALRAQMNPHFIFNCLNSIKALIQTDEKGKAIDYLTTFSKLIRTLLQNSDKRQISLYDEIETCKLYTHLEIMRFGGKLTCSFQIDPNLDLKSVMVPALIIQPFIENAIWHGIVPKENGGTIHITIKQQDDQILCEVDDDGIGRRLSQLNKPSDSLTHESKGVRLSQARLDLEKALNDTSTGIKILDKYEQGLPMGTKVILTFNIN